MDNRKLYIAAYDVTEPSRLRRMLNVVKDYATGGQKSAYECFLSDAERRELINRVNVTIDAAQDRFACIRVRGSNRPKTLGIGVKPVDLDYFYIG